MFNRDTIEGIVSINQSPVDWIPQGRTYTFRGPTVYILKASEGILKASSAWDSPVWSTWAPAVHFALGWYKEMFAFLCVCRL